MNVRLTEEMIAVRCKGKELSNIKRLNMWGNAINDVSVVRGMPNVEVISLSLNKIQSLYDFQFCKNLKELFVRQNEITNLNEILYLRDLPFLVNLWLDDNPCAANELYRPTVLRALPKLKMLDNRQVHPEEVSEAMKKGLVLMHPEEETQNTTNQWSGDMAEDRSPSPQDESTSRNMGYLVNMQTYDSDYEDTTGMGGQESPSHRTEFENSSDSIHDRLPPTSNYGNEMEQDTDRRNANYEQSTNRMPQSPSQQYLQDNYSPADDDCPPQTRDHHNYRSARQEDYRNPRISNDGRCSMNSINSPRTMPDPRLPRVPCDPRSLPNAPSRRTDQRVWNSNVLSAVLCLIKELDYPSLEVVETAVRLRMMDFQPD